MSRAFLIFCAALVALMAGALFYAARIPVQTMQSPQTADRPTAPSVVSNPSFSLPDADGKLRDFSEWNGKSRIVNFWATWCAPCRREIPLLKKFQDEQSANGFQVIGVAVDFPEEVSRYAEAAEFNYPVLVGQEEAMAVAESSGIEFMALPFTMFVAADGEYISAYMGELHASQLNTIAEVMTRFKQGEIDIAEARSVLEQL